MNNVCANCQDPALFVYAAQGTRSVSYCNKCLPAFLRPLANKGLLAKTPAFDELLVHTQEAMMPAEPAPVVEEETPAPKRKRKTAEAPAEPAEEVTEEVVEEPSVLEAQVTEEVVSTEEPTEAE